jgi:hypothetical protein
MYDPVPDSPDYWYTIDLATGWISFWLDDWTPWYLPEGSMVKVLWSSEHHATTAEQWDDMDLLYPFPEENRYPLHHDVLPKYKPLTEVFYIDDFGIVTPLIGGDYVVEYPDSPPDTIYLQDPVPDCNWLWVEYTDWNGDTHIEFFHGDGETTAFTLYMPLMSPRSISVYKTTIHEHVIEEGVSDMPPVGFVEYSTCVQLPKEDSYYNVTGGPGNTSGPYAYEPATHIVFSGLEEWEWLCRNVSLTRGDWIIRESPEGDYFSTCDELVIDTEILGGADSELKIVFKVPSGRWEWANVGETAASVDSLGNTMVVAAFKNKLIIRSWQFRLARCSLRTKNSLALKRRHQPRR